MHFVMTTTQFSILANNNWTIRLHVFVCHNCMHPTIIDRVRAFDDIIQCIQEATEINNEIVVRVFVLYYVSIIE